MKDTIMDPEIYKQLGELTGRFNTFENNMATQFSEIKQAIKDQAVVPYSIYEEHVKRSDAELLALDGRIVIVEARVKTVEDRLNLNQSSLPSRVAAFLDASAVKIIGSAVILVIIFGMYFSYKEQIDSLNNKVHNIEQVQQP